MAQFDIEVVCRIPQNGAVRCLHVRHDGSILVVGIEAHREAGMPGQSTLYIVPQPAKNKNFDPIVLKVLHYNIASIVQLEAASDVFAFVVEGSLAADQAAAVHILNLRDLDLRSPSCLIKPFKLVDIPSEAQSVSGSCLLTPNTKLVADETTACIWRVDINCDGKGPQVKKWISHEALRVSLEPIGELSMGDTSLVYNDKDACVYFASPQSKVLARVEIDKWTSQPASGVEIVATGLPGASKILLDAKRGFAHVADCDTRMLEKISISRYCDSPVEAVEHGLGLSDSVFPGLLTADWCSQEEIGKAAFLVIRCEYLSPNLDHTRLAAYAGHSGSKAPQEAQNDDRSVTIVVKVTL